MSRRGKVNNLLRNKHPGAYFKKYASLYMSKIFLLFTIRPILFLLIIRTKNHDKIEKL